MCMRLNNSKWGWLNILACEWWSCCLYLGCTDAKGCCYVNALKPTSVNAWWPFDSIKRKHVYVWLSTWAVMYTLINIDLAAMWYCGIHPRTISQEARITTFNNMYKNIYEIPTNPSGSMPGTPSKIVVFKQMLAQCQSNAKGQIIMTYA